MSEPAIDGVRVVGETIPLRTIEEMAAAGFGDMVKAVVDVERALLALGGDLHSDAEAVLLDLGSRQADLWGINLYPELYGGDNWIEYDSMINIRPRQGNRSRQVEDQVVQQKILGIVAKRVQADG